MKTGAKIKELRRLNDMTQAELAKRIGCTAQVISNIEREFSGMSADMASRMATVFGVQVETFMKDVPTGALLLSEQENDIIRNFRKLRHEDQELLIGTMELLLKRVK